MDRSYLLEGQAKGNFTVNWVIYLSAESVATENMKFKTHLPIFDADSNLCSAILLSLT